MNEEIKFSHIYKKLWSQTSGQLIDVRVRDASHLVQSLISYDTTYFNKDGLERRYKLPTKGLLIQLTFMGDKGIPFCTLRKHTPEKWVFYKKFLYMNFDVVVTDDV